MGCTDDVRLSEMYDNGLANVVQSYAIGRRGSIILDTLAEAKILADQTGQRIVDPRLFGTGPFDSTWDDILSALVLSRLGNRHCLSDDCGKYYRSQPWTAGQSRKSYRTQVLTCPHCGGEVTEEIACTIGLIKAR